MSDLISRKKICDYIKGKINPYGKPFEGTAYELGLKIIKYIDAMDSAYDVDKVVAELEKLADENYKAYCIAFNSDDRAEYDAYTNAIEIVKAGVKNE